MSDDNEPTVVELAESVRRGERKAVEVLDEYLTRIEAGNERLNVFVHLDADLAREAASAVDEAWRAAKTRSARRGAVRGEGPRAVQRDADRVRLGSLRSVAARKPTMRSTWVA